MNGDLQLSGGATWQIHDGHLYIYSDTVLKIENCPTEFVQCLPLLERGTTASELAQRCGDCEQVEQILALLKRLRLVVPAIRDEWIGAAVERQVRYFSALGMNGDAVQADLRNRHVAVVGAGGIGCVALDHFARAGVGRITVIDHDAIQRHNLNRQTLYLASDVSRPKAAAAADALAQRNPACHIAYHTFEVKDPDDLSEIEDSWDCLVVAADCPPDTIGETAEHFCESSSVPVISASCGLRLGSWGPLLRAGQVGAWRAHIGRRKREDVNLPPPAVSVMSASFGPSNAVIGSFLARDVILCLARRPVPSELCVLTLDFETLEISRSGISI